MKIAIILLTLAASFLVAFGQSTTFTYQGRLNDTNGPANGRYDLLVVDFSAPTGGSSTAFNLVTNVPVSNGLFTVTLDLGDATFPGADRWLELGVRTNGGSTFTTLSPRQPVTSTPYAIRARNFSGTISNAQLSGTYSGSVTFANASNTFAGAFNGSGAGLTNLNAWKLNGNAGTTPGTQFLGTTDNQPLEFKANGKRALRIEPNAGDAPNVIGGASLNWVAPGMVGVVIGGGGAGNTTNSVAADFGTISGGWVNTIRASAYDSTIGGGYGNTIETSAYDSIIGGGSGNTIQTSAYDSTISGGVQNTIQTNAYLSTIGGGANNTIQSNAWDSTIGGGLNNTIQVNASFTTISGGTQNMIQTNSDYSAVGGGNGNTIHAGVGAATIAGGSFNTIQTGAQEAMIGGGYVNTIQTGAYHSMIGGGTLNSIQNNGFASFIGGGYQNTIETYAGESTIGGGALNTIQTNGVNATIPGGINNRAAAFAFAAGCYAYATNTGAFVWSDNSFYGNPAGSITTNSVTFRASGGYRLFSNPSMTAGVSLAAGGTAWAVISDRNAKKDFAAINAVDILEKLSAMPITQWHYNWENAETTPHIGPMAQDFKAAFYPGSDDKSITTLEADGVAFAAIQGLNQKLEQKETEIAELKNRLERLEQLLSKTAK